MVQSRGLSNSGRRPFSALSASLFAFFALLVIALQSSIPAATAFTLTAHDNVVAYWGQNAGGSEADLSVYCAGTTYDVIIIAFAYVWNGNHTLPEINLSDHYCPTFTNSDILDCSGTSIPSQITTCQNNGKIVLLSFGGASGAYGFNTGLNATSFATTVWNMFLGGTSTMRPFGTAVLDGVDLDIENNNSQGYAEFSLALRYYFQKQTAKSYYISSAPQCVYPDAGVGPGAGTVLTSGWMDIVNVQFYNNYCGLNAYPTDFNFNTWESWAESYSTNPNVRLFVGAPGNSISAGSGYVSVSQLETILNSVRNLPHFGGVMFWTAETANSNSNYGPTISNFLKGNNSNVSPSPTSSPSPPHCGIELCVNGPCATPAPTEVPSPTPGNGGGGSPSSPTCSTNGICSSTLPCCDNTLCCSVFGYCGASDAYCGVGSCVSGACYHETPAPTPTPTQNNGGGSTPSPTQNNGGGSTPTPTHNGGQTSRLSNGSAITIVVISAFFALFLILA